MTLSVNPEEVTLAGMDSMAKAIGATGEHALLQCDHAGFRLPPPCARADALF